MFRAHFGEAPGRGMARVDDRRSPRGMVRGITVLGSERRWPRRLRYRRPRGPEACPRRAGVRRSGQVIRPRPLGWHWTSYWS